MPNSHATPQPDPVVQLRSRAWCWLLRNALLPAGDRLFRQGMMSHLRYLERAQWWDRGRLHAERDAMLQSLMRVAYDEVPVYRTLMENARVTWRDFRCPEDLQKIPIVTKAMLRTAYPHLATRDTGRRTYETSSSGSTGANFFLREDAPTAGRYRAAFLLALEWAGYNFGEPHLQNGITLNRTPDRRLKDWLLRCHYVSAFELGDAQLDATLELMERYRIRHLWGYPGSLNFLAERARVRGWNRPLASAVTWGDMLYPRYRAAIESAFGVRVSDTYGCGEGLQIAAQCGQGDHYHVFTPEVVVEFVDDGDRPAPPGTTANLVVTRLWPGPMPFIRYRVGDLGAAPNLESCPCGRGFDLLASIQGRDTDVVFTPGGNRLVVHFFTGVLEHFREIGCYQVVQSEPDAILLRIVPAPGCTMTRELARDIVTSLEAHGMADMTVHIETVAEIPVARSGKRRFVICDLPRDSRTPSPEVPTH